MTAMHRFELSIGIGDEYHTMQALAEYIYRPGLAATQIDPEEPASVEVTGLLVQEMAEGHEHWANDPDLLKRLPPAVMEALEDNILDAILN